MGFEHTGKYLAFDLGGQCYAIEVSRVEVVLETTPITRVPKAAEHLRGVINYRGAVIPVLDLGVRFGIGLSPAGPGTSIIVLSIRYGHEEITIGVLAQGVREVIDLDAAQIERPPQLGARAEDEIRGRDRRASGGVHRPPRHRQGLPYRGRPARANRGGAVKGKDILIVEDENIVALDMRMRLEAMGYRVVDVVDSGRSAVERAAALLPDLVLMDIKLKGDQDGIEAAAHLRERSEVPVIFVTAFTDERTLERAKRSSPYGYVVKPFHERELRIAIELALYKHQYELSIRRARDIAEESNRMKGEFLANMSHELKTPLNSVIGFTELALAAAKENEQREHLAIALSSAKSLLTLIESILDFARMEAGKLNPVAGPFSLDAVLGDCADALAVAAFAKGLDVSLGRDPMIPDALVGDSSLLRHIILNLLDNAVKFTDHGLIRLGASLHEPGGGPGDGPVVEFEVSDTGIGMPKDKIDQAFSRFTQLDASKTRKAGGTGLGLSIVAKAIELLDGSLTVESEEGSGSRFVFRIGFELGIEILPPRYSPRSRPRPFSSVSRPPRFPTRRWRFQGSDSRLGRPDP